MSQRAKTRSLRNHSQPANDPFLSFTASVHFDHRLWKYDIAGSIAHAHVLADSGILTRVELDTAIDGLKKVATKLRDGKAELDPKLEDIHMNVEKMLTELTGDLGLKIHTGRSRNDQVALDMRLLVRDMLVDTIEGVIELQDVLLSKARQAEAAVLPGYTHLQHAQPVLLSHHLLAHHWRLQRDLTRLVDCYHRTNVSPLGSGALAGAGYVLDRHKAAKLLGMVGITDNSLDAVSDRDFVAEAAFALSLVMIHLSSLSEEIINWSSTEFGFVKLPKHLAGGSSMMPQKINPDIAELVRGKSGRAVGDLVAVLTLLKSLPLAYNRDLQEDKENLFDVFDTAESSLHALTALLAEVEFDKVRMRRAAEAGLMTATDLADLLTTRGMPFRKAHGLVKEIAMKADGDDRKFLKLAEELAAKHAATETKVAPLGLEEAIERRNVYGGTSGKAVARQMKVSSIVLRENRSILAELRGQNSRVDHLLWG